MEHIKEYGITLQNPIKLLNSTSVIVLLQSIVTENGFHIFYHFVDYILNGDSIIEKYEVFSEDKGLQELFFEVISKPNQWIAPSGFVFKDEFIIEEDIIFHSSDYFYKDEKVYEVMMNKFEMMEETYFELFVFENVGVNYNSPDFPNSMYHKYIDEHTYTNQENM